MIVDAPWNPQLVTDGGWVCTTCGVGGRVRKGNPSNFVQTLDMVPETPATGAADFNAYGSCRPPLVIWDLRLGDLRSERSGLKIRVLRFEISELCEA